VTHQWAFVASIFAGTALVLSRAVGARAPGGGDLRRHRGGAVRKQRPVSQRGVALAWRTSVDAPADHSMIFMLIAGTYTPFAARPGRRACQRHPDRGMGRRRHRHHPQAGVDRRARSG
jgi:hypothetical protein